PGFASARDRVGIVAAIVAALAAILLRHRRHHPPPQGTAFGELHALRNRHGLVMPGCFTIVAVAGGSAHSPGLLRRQRCCSIKPEHAEEEAVQPLTLLFSERGVRRNDFHPWRGRHLVHGFASASTSPRRASPS